MGNRDTSLGHWSTAVGIRTASLGDGIINCILHDDHHGFSKHGTDHHGFCEHDSG
jgi:hypothetical protein